LIDCLLKEFAFNLRQDASRLAQALVDYNFLQHTSLEQLFDDQKSYQFVLTAQPQEICCRSFAPIRKNIKATWYVDGKDIFEGMAAAVEAAKSHIYMSWWVMSSTISMRRKYPPSSEDRIDYLLQKKAAQGIKIYVLLWDETFPARNFSAYNRKHLESLHENIACIRHPRFQPLVLSHHQKFVVVDSEIAFCGGLDISKGRFDIPEHPIADPEGRYWRGID